MGRQLRLTPAGRLLTVFLQLYFGQYVDYGFTSSMEAQLDSISGEVLEPAEVLNTCWHML